MGRVEEEGREGRWGLPMLHMLPMMPMFPVIPMMRPDYAICSINKETKTNEWID